MCEPNLISNLSSKSSMFMLSVGPLSLSGFKRIHHAAVAWLNMELPVLNRKYNLHTIIQLEEMNFASTKLLISNVIYNMALLLKKIDQHYIICWLYFIPSLHF